MFWLYIMNQWLDLDDTYTHDLDQDVKGQGKVWKYTIKKQEH